MKMRQFFLNFPQHRERERARREGSSEIGVRARQVLIKISTTARFDLVDGNSWKSLCERKRESGRESWHAKCNMTPPGNRNKRNFSRRRLKCLPSPSLFPTLLLPSSCSAILFFAFLGTRQLSSSGLTPPASLVLFPYLVFLFYLLYSTSL